ncbi:MAG: chemotaxis protein CheW [Planctomycetota bacterium]
MTRAKTWLHADERLLERELPDGYLDEWAERLRAAKAEQTANLAPAMVFRIGHELLALPAGLFSQVTSSLPVHRVPHRDAKLLTGVVNVRGELLPCISLAHMLELSADFDGGGQGRYGRRMAVVEKDGRWVFPISEMLGMSRYHPEKLAEVPATVARALRKFTLGMFSINGTPVGLLDHELLFYTVKVGLA